MENLNEKKCEGGNCGSGCGCGTGCGCGMHGMHGHGCHGFHGGRHGFFRIIIKLLIIIIIFSAGFKLGEMSGFFKAQYGYGFERGGFGMMGRYNYDNSNAVTLPSNGITTPVPAK